MSSVFVIDSSVSDYQSLVASLPANADVLILKEDSNGVVQLTEFLAGRENIDALHILSHGAEGSILLGANVVNADALVAQADSWIAIGKSLNADGDIFLYGCDVAQGEVGQAFVSELANITGADVAASSDVTGVGGDWELETVVGAINAPISGLDRYLGTLATILGTTDDDTLTGTASDDSIIGDAGNDTISGGDGNDSLSGGTGNDILNGDFGIDTAIYTGSSSGYTFTQDTDGRLIVTDVDSSNGDLGIDTLTDIEKAKFGNGTLTLIPLASRINSTTTGYQSDPATAGLSGGGYVVVWVSDEQDGKESGIYAQRYAADGSKVGPETHVNTYTVSQQSNPTILALSDGGYVIGWNSYGQDGAGWGVYVQRFAADGTAIGSESLVNVSTNRVNFNNDQYNVSLTELTDGTFVAAWTYNTQWIASGGQQTYKDVQIISQHFASDWTKIGGELVVDESYPGLAGGSDISFLNDGGYVVTYASYSGWVGQSYRNFEIYTMQYTDDGTAVGGEILVNTFTGTLQSNPVVDTLTDGSYVIAWQSSDQDGSSWGVYSQRFAADGTKIGNEVRANTTTTGIQGNTDIKALADGGYLIAWNSDGQDGDSYGIYAQRYSADGSKIGTEILINSVISGDQHFPAIAALEDGGFVITWQSSGQDGSDWGVYSKRFNADGSLYQVSISGDTSANVIRWSDALGGNLSGGEGNDALYGGTGDDNLNGDAGTDSMAGGAGNDRYWVDASGDAVMENVNEGTDLITSSVTYALPANVENLTLIGTAHINGTGNEYANTLVGNSGNNILDGGSGNDSLLGGEGDDTYVVDSSGDVVTESNTSITEIDTVRASVSYYLGDNIENLELTGSGALSGYGNNLNNLLTGNSGDNYLNGLGGKDTMIGGIGNDIYEVNNAKDITVELEGEGIDKVQASCTYTLGANVENLTLIGSTDSMGTGNDLDNTLVGNFGNNVLFGGAGNDSLNGGAGENILRGGIGNDTYIVGSLADSVEELVDEGNDTVLSSLSWTLGLNVENLVLTGSMSIDGTGNASINTITGNAGNNVISGGANNDTLLGNEGNDTLLGDEGDDTLKGGGGDDLLNGGGNSDQMAGGFGNDTYYVDNAGDSIIEALNAGIDTVYSSITRTLGANQENLILTGSVAINGTGNSLNNTLAGNSGNNILNGGAGIDIMNGGLGNDTYYVDNSGDTVIENNTDLAEIDRVFSSISWTLGANVERLTLTGTDAINGAGNALANILNGNSGANLLTGQAGKDILYGNDGNDTLNGGMGRDTLAGGAGNDLFVFNTALNATSNIDTVVDFNATDDTVRLSRTIFTQLTNTGVLFQEQFLASDTGLAADSNDYILYNTSSGALLYDADGNGAGVAVQFATLTTKPQNVTAADFVVVA